MTPQMDFDHLQELLGERAQELLTFNTPRIPRDQLHLPRPNFVDEVWGISDRNPAVLTSMRRLFNHGRLARTGYVSILPVDQGVEHSAGATFARNPLYFDPANIIRLAVEGGCSAVASTVGVLGAVAKEYAEQIPFIVKLNHNELLSYPNQHDQTMYATVDQAANMGAIGVGATIYFGSSASRRQIEEVSWAFAHAHELGMMTILWCYVRNNDFQRHGQNYENAADLTGQANYLGATIQADIVKQKLPTLNGGYQALNYEGSSYGKFDDRMYTELSSPHPIDLARYQVLNSFAGRVGLISSGGEATGDSDLAAAVTAAVINKRAGGMGMIVGRKAFQRPMAEGIALLQAIQDVYLLDEVTVA